VEGAGGRFDLKRPPIEDLRQEIDVLDMGYRTSTASGTRVAPAYGMRSTSASPSTLSSARARQSEPSKRIATTRLSTADASHPAVNSGRSPTSG
jgi:hypothetical protein